MLSLLPILTLLAVCSIVTAGDVAPNVGKSFPSVQGTFWNGATFAGSCLLQDYYKSGAPNGLEYVAVAKDVNGNAEYCGACIEITPKTTKNTPVVAIVSSHCPDCPAGALDIPKTLFNRLQGNADGRPGTSMFSWKVVTCPFGKFPKIINKDGSSKYSLSMKVVDSSYPVQSVVIISGGKNLAAYKRDYNYWELHNAGVLDDKVKVIVTWTNNQSFSFSNVDPSSKQAAISDLEKNPNGRRAGAHKRKSFQQARGQN
ncbi:hypothetical protein PTTG_03028 [Puccinia triticina 1-1 BBBD Race 1]|uniref:Expansin-like EG45 domain-containing protein n=1 Tax=Puccinia triticina (isolate 1-1 / race 1 (BBBD)) TaxID=630390 RepID=A0A0C4EQG9_PUCT1|nr:hypothetical protein PTTG_03028 [Puccinia triticina 1-1 BBBD Race 1]